MATIPLNASLIPLLIFFIDIDECLVLGSCSEPRIRCVNSPGSFDCFCPLGTDFQDGSCNGKNNAFILSAFNSMMLLCILKYIGKLKATCIFELSF